MENEQKYHRPSWDEYFMDITKIIGERGTCDRCRGGCVITKDKRIVATGYIGSPIGTPHCDDVGHEMHTVTQENGQQSRHCIRTTHAEQNAICQAARVGVSVENGTLYTKMTPCYVCGKMIVNAGIKRVVCEQDYHGGARSKEIFKEAGIEFILLNEIMTTYADMTPEKKTLPTPTQPETVQSEKINSVSFINEQPAELKKDDEEPSQFIFENIPMN
ncbi:cell division protein DedD [Candidatus Falkowbacteria bacterium CG10_big_fil_rev_8_21_14_0_10_43_10]|uniref:Cell division protein DedD n=1 Tax=Candidatus Falkowbacteria bacterium CG10_big_fil_rev_8_21_14_0_10_43_10 TaxID=1974567 RepID=A0A2H0V2N2_9BACT|nr:MAG: cell division protein DedD [Candidatus Falkowbacteria bacterium CG10_big_fil_rev_8_21_14_0_10_43_10]